MNKAKGDWTSERLNNIESNLFKNNSSKAYVLVKGLTSTKQERSTVIQNKKIRATHRKKGV